ncbi:MAG: RHS repeat-associated core domain-containing protein, partial [Candidatus Dormibacteraceae bacterium]
GLHANGYRDCYDPAIGRYCEPDPIGLGGGINPYVYAQADPIHWFDPDGRDVAVIENGPTSGNPIGHTAVAVTGAGMYSYGNNTPAGSSVSAYLLREAQRRDTTVYILKTSPELDAAILQFESRYPNTTLPGDFWDIAAADNCSVRSNGALDAAKIPYPIYNGSSIPPSLPGSAGYRALAAGATPIRIPQGTTSVPPELRQFEPH